MLCMKFDDFDFYLLEGLIVICFVWFCSLVWLLVVEGDGLCDLYVCDLLLLLGLGDLLVLNDIKVIFVCLLGQCSCQIFQGMVSVKVEIILLELQVDGIWCVLVKLLCKLKFGEMVCFGDLLLVEVVVMIDSDLLLCFDVEGEVFDVVLVQVGVMLLLFYIVVLCVLDVVDWEDYQIVWVEKIGVVVVFIVSLYFDQDLLEMLCVCGVCFVYVILYVGVGMFLFVKVDDVIMYKMYGEWGEVMFVVVDVINVICVVGGWVILVGIMVLWLIESVVYDDGMVQLFWDVIEIFIYLGYCFCVIDVLMMNFYLLKLMLLMLVSVLMGQDCICDLYDYVVKFGYCFFSYGDVLFLIF